MRKGDAAFIITEDQELMLQFQDFLLRKMYMQRTRDR